ncbi:LysR family transcriptional regulator [Pseudonocardia sp. MH-G8]|uniref:LysR family transcriptional regulator n=1 Tax=Pseudonocardia sp. MH-G8 TaxID=1854588 RepID=UPI001E5F4717|nr:LysR family transcriptional regulator [Pseudonocardia sp. MH-G8]
MVRSGQPLNPLHLRTLVEVVRTGSFAEAARRLGYTPSAVSQQMSGLERAVALALFEREAHSVRATPAAELIAQRSQEVLASFGALDHEIETIAAGGQGRLRLGSFPTASARVLPHGLAAFVERHPAVEIQLDEGEPDELLPLLQGGELDLALVYRYDLVPRRWPERLVETEILHENLLLLLPAGHRLASRQAIGPADLCDETWIASREGTAGATCLIRACAQAGFTPRVAYRSNDYDVVQGLVAAGLGPAMVPALGHDASVPGLHARAVTGMALQRHVSALHRVTGVSTPVQGVLSAFRYAAGLVASEQVRAGPAPVTP